MGKMEAVVGGWEMTGKRARAETERERAMCIDDPTDEQAQLGELADGPVRLENVGRTDDLRGVREGVKKIF